METILQSCGVADVVATSFGGRNRLCAAEFARRRVLGQDADWNEIERELLGGQKLQGLSTCREVYACLAAQLEERDIERTFPLVYRIYCIALKDAPLDTLFAWEGYQDRQSGTSR